MSTDHAHDHMHDAAAHVHDEHCSHTVVGDEHSHQENNVNQTHDHSHDHTQEEAGIITAAILEAKIRDTIEGVSYVCASDMSDGCGMKFDIEVVSTAFGGKPLLAQHRMVHKAIDEERKKIHALTLKTKSSI